MSSLCVLISIKAIEEWLYQEYSPFEVDYIENVIDLFFKNKKVFEYESKVTKG